MTANKRMAMLETIQSNISKHGHHIYLIAGSSSPRFAYTIGVSDAIGKELILAGAAFYSPHEVKFIINEVASKLISKSVSEKPSFTIDTLGVFTLREVDNSWIRTLMLGALDYYNSQDIQALQIIPDREHWTLDIPDLEHPWDITKDPAWQWQYKSWDYPVPEDAMGVTNLDALQGEKITEVMRWEDNQWELFAGAGPDIEQEDIREVPLGTLLAIDESLNVVIALDIGYGLWRDPVDLEWHNWGNGETE